MKSTALFIFSAFLFLTSCNEKHEKSNSESGGWVDRVINKDNGPIKEKEFKGDFDEIEVSQAIDAEIIKSDIEKVVISAPENIMNEVMVDNNGGRLHIHYKPGIRIMNSTKVSAKIYAKDFSKLVANSAAKITVKDKFMQEKTDITISSAASILGDLEANDFDISADSSSSFDGKVWAVDLDVETSSAGSITISGKAKNAEITSSSGSSVSAKGVIADHVKASASSGSSIEISATSSVKADASSGGSVHVSKKGNITSINKDESSGGSVSIQ
ncbi:head GIN domain-containing protein [Chryseobacterium potabilaquae]|uniref:Putative auto-transporter adhesin head GIN domain-containing protein n=1 Tax=Chryseobacterium potabilaquae TaxID=2675057 RepID=A0A6N4XC22_9FLAO|nr:head GIN domain-containing protein [Chryseobacterium potabilaquae]CAA7196108.1 hypothetical protein CHRY9293_02239 [Chryseobacterium potabilaquae]